MRVIRSCMVAGLLIPALGLAAAPPVKVGAVQLDADAGRTELVLSLSAPAEHTVFSLTRPDRIVVDVDNAELTAALPAGHGIISALRSGAHDDSLRLVLDLTAHATPRSFLRQGRNGPEIVIDLFTAGQSAGAAPVAALPAVSVPAVASASAVSAAPTRSRDIVVAIDAGHGGKDPGAHGPKGALEKNVTLAVARRLAGLINQQPGMRAVLTRDGDYFIELKQRFEKARAANADLFVSIHCDASRDKSADGATVYVLSEHGATTEHARWLEKQENDADLLGGVKLANQSPEVKSVLVDMSQSAVMGVSFDVGTSVARQLAAIGAMHRNAVQQAGFMVLKAPDVPSMLIETNYITNPRTARLLTSTDYQQQLAKAIFSGVSGYFTRYPPPGTEFAALRDQREDGVMAGNVGGGSR